MIDKYRLHRDDFGFQVAFVGRHGNVCLSNSEIVKRLNGHNNSCEKLSEQNKQQLERITQLEADVRRYQYMMCDTCGGAGSVGNAPDDYYDCPKCVQPFNEMERKLKAQDAEIIKLVDRLQSCEDDNGILTRVLTEISNMPDSRIDEAGCMAIKALEATKPVKAVQSE